METGQFSRQTADITQNPGGMTYATVKPRMSVWREQNGKAATAGLWFTSNFQPDPITHSIDYSELWPNGSQTRRKKWTHSCLVWELYYSSLVPRRAFVKITVVYLISEKRCAELCQEFITTPGVKCACKHKAVAPWKVFDGKTNKCASFGRNSC